MGLLVGAGGAVRHDTWPADRRGGIVRARVALLLLALVASGCAALPGASPGPSLDAGVGASLPSAVAPAPAPADSPPSPDVRDGAAIQQVLDQVAAAFRDGDADRLVAHLATPDSAFGQRWQDRARHMTALPLASYALRLDDSLPDLSTQRIRDSRAGRVQVVYVVEELALEGFDPAPAAADLFLTVVDDGDGWQVLSDVDAEALGFVSADHLWDHGPVEVTVRDAVMAIHHPDGPDVAPLLDDTAAALDEARERWPRAWPERVPVIVPRDEAELGALLHATFDLTNFVAFATATPVGELGEYELTGSRIVINPPRLLDRSPEVRQRILVHELVHVATRPSAGPMVPSWLEEGVAQALGEQRSTTGTAQVDALPADQLALPTDGQFTVGGRDRIFLSYQLAWAFVDHLVDTHGVQAVGAFYVAAGRQAVGRPGTEQFHVDRAAREVFGTSLADLLETWRATR